MYYFWTVWLYDGAAIEGFDCPSKGCVIELEFAPKEKFVNNKQRNIPKYPK